MLHHRTVFFLLLVVICLAACAQNSSSRTISPTAAPTVQNLARPTASQNLQSSDSQPLPNAPRCLSPDEAARHYGETACVEGNVQRTYSTNTAFFIEFTSSVRFFATSLKYHWKGLEGNCYQVSGEILEYNARPYIVVQDDTLYECGSQINLSAPRIEPTRVAPSQSTNSGCPQGCTSPPSGCVIKGNVSFDTGEKIYHMPGDAYYSATVINSAYGERWFCSAAEAERNGWRRTRR